MKLFQLVVSKSETKVSLLSGILHKEFSKLQSHAINYRIKEQVEQDRIHFYCQFWPITEHTIDTFDRIREAVGHSVANFIVEHKERDLLREVLIHEFGLTQEEQIEDIIRYTYFLLNTDEHGEDIETERALTLRKNIASRVVEYFLHENQLFFEGFIRFRLKDQYDAWRTTIEHAIDEYWVEKENKDFFGLIKQFLSSKQPGPPLVHLVHIDDRNLFLYDQQWSSISAQSVELIPTELFVGQLGNQDLILHLLISLAPARITIHTVQPNHHIIYTIKQIFEPSAEVCNHCSYCQRFFSNGQSSFTNKNI
ncbi:putative sporulation protein YtxC [Ammoniphilus sp. YIM 78166]|uniref:putative sporulation protein YtxC n=1 Tax=Ammoniphilus sp. YIM 78166 TaxID=1644106 RepID=UPI0010704BD3|nr:putative sporulation protein YtxC [Ammoniphilus sp. YIM 78166]